ncbi:MAG: aconitase/3-isopropylmalate dehydratase large subunit family protein [Syntrophomonas sp.]
MGMTITEKILAKSSGKNYVKPGDFVWANVDTLMIHDPCAPGVIGNFHKELGNTAKIWAKEKLVIIPDHFIYTTDEKANRNLEVMREFAQKQNVKYFYNPGSEFYQGVCHITLAQEGHVRPGNVLIGTDSHTVTGGAFAAFATGVGNTDASYVMATGQILLKVPHTIRVVFKGEMPQHLSGKDLILRLLQDLTVQGATYMAIEFEGSTIDGLSVEERMTICNMSIEAGAKNGIMKVNQTTMDYLNERMAGDYTIFESDKDANYVRTLTYDTSKIEPMVAKPHSPDNCVMANELNDQKVTRAYIGSCTGGKTEDLVAAASILKGRKVKVETYVVPSTKKVISEIINTSINGISVYKILTDAGVKMSLEPSCAACCGGPTDTFGRLNCKEICISTTNRNFRGRMGNQDSEIYLASAKTVAASALIGKITDPRNI